jgi:molecular chaperone GrpE
MPNSHVSEEEQQQAPEEQQRDLSAELAQMEDRWKRSLADLDNYRKRTARDTDRRVADTGDAMVRDWLDVLDSIERGIQSVPPENPMAPALRAVLEQMEGVLARHGVQRTGAAGEQFDPNVHDAVSVVDTTEVPDRTITEVVRPGFTRDGRVIRPAQVVVARGG